MFPACCFRHRAQGLFNGYSMRLELTLVSSINDLWLVTLVYIGVVVPLSWSVFTLVLFTRLFLKYILILSLDLQQPSLYIYIYIYKYIYIYIYIYIYTCVCVCVCVYRI